MASSNRKKPPQAAKVCNDGGEKPKDSRLKIKLSESERAIVNAKRGRLSFSEYFRDRALFDDQHYEPRIAAIGKVYLAAGSIVDTARCLREREVRLREIEDDLLERMRIGSLGREAGATIANELGQHSSRLFDAIEGLKALGQSLQDIASEIGREHLGRVREQHPTPTIKRRRTKPS